MERVMYRRTLCKKFRVGGNLHLHITHQKIMDKLVYLIVCTHRHRRFHHNQAVSFHRLCDLPRNGCDITQIC